MTYTRIGHRLLLPRWKRNVDGKIRHYVPSYGFSPGINIRMCSGVDLSLESNLRFASVFEVNSEKWIWLPDHFSLIETGDILAHMMPSWWSVLCRTSSYGFLPQPSHDATQQAATDIQGLLQIEESSLRARNLILEAKSICLLCMASFSLLV
jgi:hypothetical protein